MDKNSGDYENGELLTWTEAEGILEHDIRGEVMRFNGLEWHANRTLEGRRCTMIAFEHLGRRTSP